MTRPGESDVLSRRQREIFLILAGGLFAYALLQSVTVPALPMIQREMNTDQATVSWVLTAFLLSASVATPIGGRLGDVFGKRRLLVWSFLALAVGALVAALASSIEVLIVARVVQGLGGAAMPLVFGIIRDEFPPRRVAGVVGVISSLLAIGFAVGIVVAGPIVDLLGYRWLFLLPAIICAAAAMCVLFLIPKSTGLPDRSIPWRPGLLLAGWLVSLLLGVSNGPKLGWLSTSVTGFLVAALILFVLWLIVERAATVPLVDLRLLRRREIWPANLVGFLIGMTMFSSAGLLPQFVQTPGGHGYGFGVSVAEAGYMMIPQAVGSFFVGLASARLAAALGLRRIIFIGCMIVSTAFAMAAFAHDEKWELYVISGLSGLGTGVVFACLSQAIVTSVPAEQTGIATGMNQNFRTIGGAIGIAVVSTLLMAYPQSNGYPAERGYAVGFVFLTLGGLIAGVIALRIPRTTPEVPQGESTVTVIGGVSVVDKIPR